MSDGRPISEAWFIVETAFDAALARASEGLLTLGSGYLHIRGSLEEHLSGCPQNREYRREPGNVTAERFDDAPAKWGTYVPGVFGPHPTLNNEMINLPWFLSLAPIVDGTRLDAMKVRILVWRRTLDLQRAVLRRHVTWETDTGRTIETDFERFVSAVHPGLCVQRMSVLSDGEAELMIRAGIDADVRTNGHDHFTRVKTGSAGEDAACAVRTDGGDEVTIRSRLRGGTVSVERTERSVELVCAQKLKAGAPVQFEKRTAVSTSRDQTPGDANAALDEAAALPYERLLEEHAAAWRRRWDRSDIEIEGDADSQRALRVSLYHLLRAHVPDPRVAIDAKGYAGEAYWGRYFWDTEMYLLPFYLYTDPARARTLVDFRVRTLAGARANARRYRYPGARYAWESDAHGIECCPNWQYADHEVHITADVVHGIAHYAAGSGDAGFARSAGESEGPARVIVETARYWLARLDRRAGEDRPSLLGVMGPDEYTPISNNNAFTNRMVSAALELAAEVGGVGGAGGATPEEIEAFRSAADGLGIPMKGDLVLQCEGFDSLAEPRLEEWWSDRARPLAAQVSQERLYRSKALKQADVLMLMMLFPDEFSDEQVRAAWDYYLPYTTHDSSLSAGVHAIVACRLGLSGEAWRFWEMGRGLDLDGGAAEGVHIAACGAVWQMAVFGFAGMHTALQSEELRLAPRVPDRWKSARFPITWKGQRTLIGMTEDRVEIENLSDAPLAAIVWDRRAEIGPGATEVFSR